MLPHKRSVKEVEKRSGSATTTRPPSSKSTLVAYLEEKDYEVEDYGVRSD